MPARYPMRQQPKVLRLQAFAHGAQRDRPGDQENSRAHRYGEDAQRQMDFPRTAKQADHRGGVPRRHADRGGRDAVEFDLLMGLVMVQAQEQDHRIGDGNGSGDGVQDPICLICAFICFFDLTLPVLLPPNATGSIVPLGFYSALGQNRSALRAHNKCPPKESPALWTLVH